MLFNKRPYTWDLVQINQTTSILFAHCTQITEDTYEQITPFCRCRDFFNDLILKNQLKEDFIVYNFKYLQELKQRDEDFTLFALSISNKQEYNNFLINIKRYLPQIELTNKINPYELIIPENSKSIIIIKADKYWQSHPLILSFFTFILRCFCYTFDNNQDNLYTNVLNSTYKIQFNVNEIKYLNDIDLNQLLFFQNNLKQLIPEDYQQSIYTENRMLFHDQCGFYNFLKHKDINRIIVSHIKLKEQFNKLYEQCPVDANPVTPS